MGIFLRNRNLSKWILKIFQKSAFDGFLNTKLIEKRQLFESLFRSDQKGIGKWIC